MWLRLLALACATGIAIAGPFQKETSHYCAKQCTPRQQEKLQWKVGSAYVYHYQSENNVVYRRNQKQKSSLEATVEYHILTKCDVLLKMKNVKINQKLTEEEKEDLKKKLELPLVYSNGDGTFETVCPSLEESTQSLNIKKALISSFVITMSKLDTPEETEEHDSLGKCITKYSIKYGKGLIVRKEKDLKTCTNRQTFLSSFLKQKFPSSLIFESDHLECQQYIENEIIKKVECKESERMKPPMKHQNSWIEFSGSFEQELIETKSAENFQLQEPLPSEDILFDLEESRKGDSNAKEVERILRKLCFKNIHVVDISISSDFMKLVASTKGLSYEQLDKIYESLKNGKICSSKKVRDIFVDTLPVMGTDASVKLMVKLIESQDITGLKAKLWPASFSLISEPTQETAAAIIPLLKQNYSIPIMLGVSAMMYKLCSLENCDAIDSVDEVISIFNQNLGQNCSSEDDDKMLAALKAFGNMGYHGKARENIIACVKDSSKSSRLRLSAVDAFRRINNKRPDELIEIYSNRDEDYEVRIAAFASAIKHADHEQFRKIKEAAESETDEQVSGYVYTFMRNLNKTSSPEKQKIRKLYEKLEIRPPKVNYWENSKNIEVSGFSESLNIGGGIETDIIHSSGSKIPRSVYTRLNVDIFDKNVNLLEFGIRAEGLAELLKKVIGLKDTLPKERSWDIFTSKHLTGYSDTELSLFVRTFNTEIFDLSASDLSGLGEMIRIADVMNKLARGKDADFSHSLVFMNSKLVIPSVTGRSYTFDFTGTSTVGLTAKSKVDLLSLPRNADVHLHFQPSANIELSTTVGIQSNKHRPDIKILSRLYFESDIETKFQIKDGHIAIASLKMPSENVALIKLSTDVLEIDAHHKEKHIYEKMQKKIDYCFKGLQNTLGITACTKVEVPKPFVIKTFPYLLLFGSTELALKRSDDSFTSYEIHLEIPKHSDANMKFKASLDTPGSKISRRFVADLEIKQQRDLKQFSIQLTSPFKTIGGSGTYTKNDKLIKGSFELHSNSKEIFSINLTSKITPSRSRNIYETTGVVSYLDQEPTRINGSITVIKGRKHDLSFAFRTNKPLSKPVILKGTIMKEGSLELMHRTEGKLSTDVSLESPLGDLKLKSTVETRSKKLQSISVNFGIDYQKPGKKKYSVKFAGTSQKGREKINTNSKFEIAEFPEANWYLNWDIVKESRESLKNDVILKYGSNPEKFFIHLQQQSRMPELSNGVNEVRLKVPHLNVNYQLLIKHDLKLTATPKLYAEAELSYKDDKHIKGIVDVKYESKSPLKASARLELEHPGGHYIFENEIVETSYNIIEGKSKLQYKHGKIIQLKYKYKKLSDDSKFHHDIESSLQTPTSSSPIKSKFSLQVNSKSLTAVGLVGPKYSIQAYLSQEGVTHINVKSPMIEGKIKLTNEVFKKNINLDLNMKTSNPRHVIASLLAEKVGNKRTFQLEIVPDVDHHSENKILVSTVVEVSKRSPEDTYCSLSRLHIFDLIDVTLSGSGVVSFQGNQEFDLAYTARGWEPAKVTFKREINDVNATTFMTISRKDVDVAKIQADTSLFQYDHKQKLSIKLSIISPKHSFDDLDMHMIQEITNSKSSESIKSHLFFKKKDKVFKAEWSSDIQPNSVELKAKVQTPYVSYEKQALGIHFRRSAQKIQSSLNIEIPNNKMIFIESEIKEKNHGFSATWKLNSTFEKLEDVQAELIVSNYLYNKSLEVYIDVNDSKSCQEGCMGSFSNGNEVSESFKISNLPKSKFQRFQLKLERTKRSLSIQGRMGLMNGKDISVTSESKVERHSLSTTTVITTPYKKLKDAKIQLSIENQPYNRNILGYFDLNGQRKGYIELVGNSSTNSFAIQGHLKAIQIPEISFHSEFVKQGESFSFSANVSKNTLPLLATNLKRLSYKDGEKLLFKAKSFENTVLDLEVLEDVSGENSYKYSLKAFGSFSPISITFSTNHNDKTSVNKEFRVCQEVHPIKCYILKSYHKILINSDNYRYYQKFTVDVTKIVGGFPIEALGSLYVLVSKDQYDYMSKVLFEKNDKKIGYELKLHRRQHGNDKFVLGTYVYLPQRSSNLKASILHNTHILNVEVEAIPNTIDSTRKLSFEMKKEVNPQISELSGYIKVSHPELSQPLLLTYKFQEVEPIAVQGKLVLYSTWGETLTAEIVPSLEQKPSGGKSITYKLYTESKSLDVSLKLMKRNSRDEDKIGYEWKYNFGSSQKKGGIMITLYDKKTGKPKSIKISFLTPTSDYEIQGSFAQVPNGAVLCLVSGGKKVREIHVKASDSCLDIEITRSVTDHITKTTLCINHREGDTLQLVKADLFYRQQKCLDVLAAVGPEKPAFVDVALKWKTADISRALSEVTGWKHILHSHYLSDITKELKEKVDLTRRNVLEPLSEKLKQKIKIMGEEISWRIKNMFRHSEFLSESVEAAKNIQNATLSYINSSIPWEYIKDEIVRPLKQAFSCYIQEYALITLEHMQEFIKVALEVMKSQIDHCRKKFCNPRTFCHRFLQTHQLYDFQRIKALIYRKISEMSKDLKVRITTVNFKDIINWIHDFIQQIKKIIESVFGKYGDVIISKIGDYCKKLEKKLRQKAIDAIDKIIDYINKIFGDDEDYKIAKSLVIDANKKLMNVWKNKEEIVENSLRPIKNKLMENISELIEEKFQVLKFDLKGGEINFRFHQPLGPVEIQILKNELQTIKRKLEGILDR
ncbi:Vitellogenin [Araneus ventricosus]|uniref:Vitellogenin n=1 Tax=Araneus ventricosus TaxID=182803 RepID=A0A4Y2CLL0_ARAVE|nr:Vitellogenin [Araneus ventricosus]